MGLNQAIFSYPGIESYEDVTWTDQAGISPSVIIVTVFPQYGFPDPDGDCVFSYNDTAIRVAGCTIDSYAYQQNSGGKVVHVKILDSRWRWKYGRIDGRYNIRLPDNFVNPDYEKTPQELATLCFEAMGEDNYDVTALPNDARPDVDWEGANPAQELASICDSLGCRIVPQRSTGAWVICVTGAGADLPDDLPYQDSGDGVDPQEVPDFLQVLTAPVFYQVALKLAPVGKNMDQSWEDLKHLSYAPEPSVETTAWGFGYEPSSMYNCSSKRVAQEDGTKISPREMALATVLRSWRIAVPASEDDDSPTGVNDDPTVFIDGYDDYVTRKQIILSDHLVQSYTDNLGGIHQRPSFVWGEFKATVRNVPNYPPGTRIDYQGVRYIEDPEERASFSVSLDPNDTDRSIISTSQPMLFQQKYTPPGKPQRTVYGAAKLFYTCAIQIRDPDTWVPIRDSYTRHIGDGNDETNVMTVVKNDIQPWIVNLYDEDGEFVSNTNNDDEVQAQVDYYLDALQLPFQTINTKDRTYIGIYSIDLDGMIQQSTIRIGKSGADMRVSAGTEHSYVIPPYAERRQRDGRRNLSEKVKLQQEIADRRTALRGTFNT